MTLQEHILNCLPYLIGEESITEKGTIFYLPNTIFYFKEKGEWVLCIFPSFQNMLKRAFNIDNDYVHNIISKYLGITAISHFPKIRQLENRYFTYLNIQG